MALFSVLLLLQNYLQTLWFEESIRKFAQQSQIFCQGLLDFSSEHLIFYQALACGVSIPKSVETYDILKTLSLWHLVVVSAGHFQILLWIINKIPRKNWAVEHTLLLIFTLATGAQAPIVRSYFDLLISRFSKKNDLHIPSPYRCLYSGCLCLLLFPDWSQSWSLILSWICSLLIFILEKKSPLTQAFLFSLALYPVMSLFSPPHPLGFLFNFLLSGFLSAILFPASLLLMVCHPLALLLDPCLTLFLKILNQLVTAPMNETPKSSASFFLIHGWIYVMGLQGFAILYLKFKWKASWKDQKN